MRQLADGGCGALDPVMEDKIGRGADLQARPSSGRVKIYANTVSDPLPRPDSAAWGTATDDKAFPRVEQGEGTRASPPQWLLHKVAAILDEYDLEAGSDASLTLMASPGRAERSWGLPRIRVEHMLLSNGTWRYYLQQDRADVLGQDFDAMPDKWAQMERLSAARKQLDAQNEPMSPWKRTALDRAANGIAQTAERDWRQLLDTPSYTSSA